MTTPAVKENRSVEMTNTLLDRGLHDPGAERQGRYTPEQRDRLRAVQNIGEASDADLDVLFAVSSRTGLDPFAKEIYLVGRRTKTGGYRGEPERWETRWTVQTGIDGFRKALFRAAKAENTNYEIGPVKFYNEKGEQFPFWPKSWGNPTAAVVEVKLGNNVGYGTATWDSFAQTTSKGQVTQMWQNMPDVMLGKCAIAQAIRNVCSLTQNLYMDEEMHQASEVIHAKAERQQPAAVNRVHQSLSRPRPANTQAAQPQTQQHKQPEPQPMQEEAQAAPEAQGHGTVDVDAEPDFTVNTGNEAVDNEANTYIEAFKEANRQEIQDLYEQVKELFEPEVSAILRDASRHYWKLAKK